MQEQLVEILRHKGIGPKGSKHISIEECEMVFDLLFDKNCALTTKATFLTALFLLDRDDNETKLVEKLSGNNQLDKNLLFLVNDEPQNKLEEIILTAIKRTDLNEEKAKQGIELAMAPQTPEYLTASFLEALRLKRETDLENNVFYTYFLNSTKRIECNFAQIIEIGDSYDGVNRNNNYNLFTACVLGALGYKTFISGNKTVAPKNGTTHHQVLLKADKNPFLTLNEAVVELENNNWVYIDQSVFDPALWNEKTMREEMVKRPCLATFEKILSPIFNKTGNDIITSYTHAHYKQANIEILKNSPYTRTALNIKGLEGTVTPKHNVSTPVVKWHKKEVSESNYKFSDLELLGTTDISATEALQQGVAFLKNNSVNQASQYIKNTCALILTNLGYEKTQEEVFNIIEDAINSGKVYDSWQRGLKYP